MDALTPLPPRRRAGYSLIEVLLAVLVVGVGALGVAGLQLLSSQNVRAALERSVALLLAEDMLELIRANPDADYVAALGDAPASFADCLASSCTPAELAAFDVALWKCSLGRWHDEASCQGMRIAGLLDAPRRQPGLPAGDGAIAVDAAGVVVVTVTWQSAGERSVVVGGWR